MKKKVELKKLKLNKEKIMTLSDTQSEKVIGGKVYVKEIPQSERVCDSYDIGCTHDSIIK